MNGAKLLPLPNHELLIMYLLANISIESSSLSETIGKLSCFTLEVFDESCDVHSIGQRMVEIDEEWQQIVISLHLHFTQRHQRNGIHPRSSRE